MTGSMNLSKRRLGPACSHQLGEGQGACKVSAQKIGHALAQHILVTSYGNPVRLAVGGDEAGLEVAQIRICWPGPEGTPRGKCLQKPGQRGQRGAQVLIDDGGKLTWPSRGSMERNFAERAIEVPAPSPGARAPPAPA